MRLTPFLTDKVGGWPLVKCPLSPVRVLVVTLEANWRAVCCTVNLLYLFIDPFGRPPSFSNQELIPLLARKRNRPSPPKEMDQKASPFPMTRPPLALSPSGLSSSRKQRIFLCSRRRPTTLRACGVFARRYLPVVPSSPLAA